MKNGLINLKSLAFLILLPICVLLIFLRSQIGLFLGKMEPKGVEGLPVVEEAPPILVEHPPVALIEKKKKKFILLGPVDSEEGFFESILVQREGDVSKMQSFVMHGPEGAAASLPLKRRRGKEFVNIREPLMIRRKKGVTSKFKRGPVPESIAVKKEEPLPVPIGRVEAEPSAPPSPLFEPILFTSVLLAIQERPRELDPADVMTLAAFHQFLMEASMEGGEPSEAIAAVKEEAQIRLAPPSAAGEVVDAAAIEEKVETFFTGKKKKEEPDHWDPYPWPKRITARHVWGYQEKTCIPFATNFTTLDLFIAPDYRPGHLLPFLDLQGHRFDNNTYAANGGVGARFIPSGHSGLCEMLGFNAYYDYRQGNIGYYQQIGAGVEVLGRRWDFRGNVYVPFGNKRHMHACVFNNYVGNYYAIRRDIESVSYSFNGEIGYLAVNGKNFSFYLAVGPYFLVGADAVKAQRGSRGESVRNIKIAFLSI